MRRTTRKATRFAGSRRPAAGQRARLHQAAEPGPGSTADPAASTTRRARSACSRNGNRGRSNNYLLDGTDMNDGYRNLPAINQGGVFGTPSTILPVDAVEELPILSGVEAEYGGTPARSSTS